MNWLSALLVKPRLLPRLDFSAGITPDCRTMVVVPTLLTSLEGVDRLIEKLEIHHLSNRDPRLHFALLTDFGDAPEETLPEDQLFLDRARSGIETLNRRYPSGTQTIFFLFHRPRRWNAGEALWMGHERKRGTLMAFNSLLRGGSREFFSEIVGETSVLPEVKYVITLDTDTELPRDAARQLAGTMAHPLNRPVFDARRRIVAQGYSILQPRVGVNLPSSGRSWFVRLFSGDAGIDPYTRAVSDVYQDLFGEGSFIGKGIYDVDAFDRAMAGRFPENTVLSHDLLEACHARSALVSDVEFYEEFPSRYNVDMSRRHRWIRGDWQILQWLLPRVPGADVRRIANPLSWLSRWKIFDNLRRSLVPSALMLLLLGVWLLLPESGGLGTLLVLAIVALPGLLATLVDAFRKPADLPWLMHLRAAAASGGRQFAQVFLTLAFLPYDALISLDAIGRTLVRLLFTRKRLLQWQTSSDSERTSGTGLAGFYATMWIAPIAALLGGLSLLWLQPTQMPLALPFFGIWLAAPWIAWRISQPIQSVTPDLTAVQSVFLRRIARKTWHFFDTFVTAQENWLPPDNFQEVPVATVASRTSPTNMGLALLANLAARDLGYLAVGRLIERTENALATMQSLERHRGHFYNWYDTRSLVPLLPLYVSSVDSGNLAGHLLTLGSGLRELPEEKILAPQIFDGLRDTVEILRKLAGANSALAQLEAELAKAPASLAAGLALLEQAAARAGQIAGALANEKAELADWGRNLEKSCQEHRDDLLFLAPWLALPVPPPEFRSRRMEPEIAPSLATEGNPGLPAAARLAEALGRLDRVPTLREVASLDQSLAGVIEAAANDFGGEEDQTREREREWLAQLSRSLAEAGGRARRRLLALENLARQCGEMAEMDFTFLSDPDRNLFSIGFNVTERRRDPSFYDLLASEARLGSYVAIAQGQVPQDHWFSLGRLLVAARGGPILVSWSGSMFEYLMPLLVMPDYRRHPARPQLQRGGPAANRIWAVARRPLGSFRIGLQPDRCEFELSIPGVRRPGFGLEAGIGRGSGHRPIRRGHGVDGRAAAGLRKPATDGARGPGRRLRPLRSRRLHALAPAPGRNERHHPFLHGPPSGDEPAGAGESAAGPPDAAALHGLPRAQGDGIAVAGAGTPDRRQYLRQGFDGGGVAAALRQQ